MNFILLLGLCACSGTPFTPGTPPAAKGTSSETSNLSSPGNPEFRLSKLPDIGAYKIKKAACFYDEPLKEFRESYKYGTIIPYCVTSDADIPSYGFMTADGRVITAAIYNQVNTMHGKDGIVYGAAHKNFVFNEEFSETDYSKRVTDMIRFDGGKMVSMSAAQPSAVNSGELIECRVYSGDIPPFSGDTLLLYDYDLNLVADLSPYDIANSTLLEGDRNSYVFETSTNNTKVMFFENGDLKNTVDTDNCFSDVCDGMICTGSGIYDKAGKELYKISGKADYDIDRTDKSVYFTESGINSVTKMKAGEIQRSRRFTGDRISQPVVVYQDGQTRLVLTEKDDRDNVSGFIVLDSCLNTLSTIGLPEADFECDTWETRSVCCFTVVQNGKTEIFDLYGKHKATLNFENSYPSLSGGCVTFLNEAGALFIYDPYDGSVTEYDNPMPGKEPGYTMYLTDKILIWSYCFERTPNDTVLCYCLTDRSTKETLHKNISDMIITDTGDKTFISITENGITYVYDGELDLVTSFLNDYYA